MLNSKDYIVTKTEQKFMTILKAGTKLYLLSFLTLFWGESSTAQQMIQVPLENNIVILEHLEKNPQGNARNNQVCPVDTLMLPFFDDFAVMNSIYPDCNKWLDNHVFVNGDMAYNPPSIGVATFDGLSSDGSPYNVLANVSAGSPADTLTSQYLDLSAYNAGSEVYLSFFCQKQGLSDRPEVQDSFILEFKDTNEVWKEVWSLPGISSAISSLTIPEFEQFYIKIDSGNYLYNGFQFRFRNLASISGNNDHWHLDYVMLDELRANNADTLNINYGRYADVAFTHRPTTPLKNGYTAMPWRHFVDSSSWASAFVLQNFNHNATGAGTLDRRCTVDEISPNPSSLLIEGIPAVPSYVSSPNIDDSLSHTVISNFGAFNPTEKTLLKTTYTILNPSGFQSNPIFLENDTCRTETVLDNYFAYDDGTAETRIIAQGQGTKIAVEFTAEVDDTLQGIYFHLPYFTNRNAELDFINIKVWVNALSDANEVFSRDLHHLQYRWGFNGFYFVDMVDFTGAKYLIPLQAGQKFYVGWEQSFGPEVPVGFDRSTDSRDKTFVGTGTIWVPATISGSVMIRPLLSPDSNYQTIPVTVIEEPVNQLTIYPNPTQDILNLELDFYDNAASYHLLIHNALGQVIHEGAFENQLSLGAWQAGMYILSLRDEKGSIIAQQKIIKE